MGLVSNFITDNKELHLRKVQHIHSWIVRRAEWDEEKNCSPTPEKYAPERMGVDERGYWKVNREMLEELKSVIERVLTVTLFSQDNPRDAICYCSANHRLVTRSWKEAYVDAEIKRKNNQFPDMSNEVVRYAHAWLPNYYYIVNPYNETLDFGNYIFDCLEACKIIDEILSTDCMEIVYYAH